MENVYYEIKDGKRKPIEISKKWISKRIFLENLYIADFSAEYYIVVNSFKNKTLILNKFFIDGCSTFPENLYFDLETPSPDKSNLDVFYQIVEDCNKSIDAATFIIAMSYRCNLHCSYCYQQHDSSLNKKLVTMENVEKILHIIAMYKIKNPNKVVDIGLFGGEPLLPENFEVIKKVFDFCTKNLIQVHITTNGTNLDFFLKFLVIHRKLISSINTTIDSLELNSLTRKYVDESSFLKKNTSDSILRNCKILLDYNVPVDIATNIDAHNVSLIENIHDYFVHNGFFSYPHFRWDIGRVDDRLNETHYKDILYETEILSELLKLRNSKQNFHAAFLKTIQPLCNNIGIGFNQTERRGVHNYCWASSSQDVAFYIDADLDVFRCTYTVGRKAFSIFKFSLENIMNFTPKNRTFIDYEICRRCKIGGYCSGGCALSFSVARGKQCDYELKNFNKFITDIYIPAVTSIFHEGDE